MQCWILVVVLVILVLWFLTARSRRSENYVLTGVPSDAPFNDYKQMTKLPWCDNPISTLSPCNGLRRYYPGQRFPTGVYPISCPPDKVSIYETGNAQNPNTTSTWRLGKEINPVYNY